MAITVTITGLGRPLTVNRSRQLHRHDLAREVRGWRDGGYGSMVTVMRHNRGDPEVAGLIDHIGSGGSIIVEAWPIHSNGRSPQDVGACYPAVKAAIDGFVDAELIPDDDAYHLFAIIMHAPLTGEQDGLRLRVKPDHQLTETT